MERVKSKFKILNVNKGGKREKLVSQLIHEPYKHIKGESREKLIQQIDSLIQESWGRFDREYIEESILKSYFLCLIYNSNDRLIALAPLKKLNILGSDVYSFGLSAVTPNYRKLDLLKEMGLTLTKKVFIENILKGKFSMEIIFITPNIRTLGTISRFSEFIYPNPYKTDENGRVGEADDETWKRVQEFLRLSNEKYRNLEREGCIMEGFYDDKEELAYKARIEHDDKKVEKFGEKYLYTKPGREVVVRAIVSAKGVLNANRSH